MIVMGAVLRHDPHCQRIFTVFQKRRDITYEGDEAALMITGEFTIDVKFGLIVYTDKIQQDTFSG